MYRPAGHVHIEDDAMIDMPIGNGSRYHVWSDLTDKSVDLGRSIQPPQSRTMVAGIRKERRLRHAHDLNAASASRWWSRNAASS